MNRILFFRHVLIGLLLSGLLVACGGGGGGGSSGPSGPTVIATLPVDSAVGAVPTAPLGVTFSLPVQTSSVDANSFTLTGPSGSVPGTVAAQSGGNGATAAIFTPNSALAFDTEYTARLTSAILDTSGRPLTAYEWRFNTGKRLAAGESHSCARFQDGRLKCWGRNATGQLGLGDPNHRGDQLNEMGDNLPAVDLGSGRRAVQVVAGGFYTCARLDNGQVKCWGENNVGQLGLGDQSRRGDQASEMGNNLSAVDLGTGRSALEVTAGSEHTCARLDNGQVKCWGRNNIGQLGLGESAQSGNAAARGDEPGEMGDSLPAVDLGNGRTAVQIAAGASHSCARLDNDQIKCWGSNGFGQLGLGDTGSRGDEPNEMGNNLPMVNLGSGRQAVQVVASGRFTCAQFDNGQVKCWGDNDFGKLGLGDQTRRGDQPNEMGDNLPAVNFGSGQGATAEKILLGAEHACVRLPIPVSSGVKCWGHNNSGQLGLGDINNDRGDGPNEMGDNLPTLDLGRSGGPFGIAFQAIEVVAGGFHNCAYLSNGQIKCWGDNASGQLGLGDTSDRGDQLNEMGNLLPAVDVGN